MSVNACCLMIFYLFFVVRSLHGFLTTSGMQYRFHCVGQFVFSFTENVRHIFHKQCELLAFSNVLA